MIVTRSPLTVALVVSCGLTPPVEWAFSWAISGSAARSAVIIRAFFILFIVILWFFRMDVSIRRKVTTISLQARDQVVIQFQVPARAGRFARQFRGALCRRDCPFLVPQLRQNLRFQITNVIG